MARKKDIRESIKGRSPLLLEALARLERVAKTKLPVLILGETGTGKESKARLVHERSPRREGPYHPVNCAAIPEALLESMLFGHKRGAFTGALDNKRGVFEAANGGSVFLDEIGEMPLPLQAKVLRVLEEGTFQPVGSQETRRVDVRIIAATHRDLHAMVQEKQFREDLYYRLGVYAVRIPALRERGRDLVILARHHLHDLFPNKRLSRESIELLSAHSWPGNIRELRNVVQAAGVDAGRTVQPKHLCYHLSVGREAMKSTGARADAVLAVIDKVGSASPAEIRAATDISRSTLRRVIKQMIAAGDLVRLSDGPNTRYARPETDQGTGPLTARHQLILRHMKDVGRVTRQEAATLTGTSIRTASRELALLMEMGLLVPDGRPGKTAGYVAP